MTQPKDRMISDINVRLLTFVLFFYLNQFDLCTTRALRQVEDADSKRRKDQPTFPTQVGVYRREKDPVPRSSR